MQKKNLFCILFVLLSAASSTQVPVRFEPRHKPVLENQYIRLLDVHLPPADTSLFHIHEIPSFFVPLSTTAIGIEVKGQQPQQTIFTIGNDWYNGFENGPLIHRVWNSDTNILHVMDIELLSRGNFVLPDKIAMPRSKIGFENDKLRAYKIGLSPGEVVKLSPINIPMLLIAVSGPAIELRTAKDDAGVGLIQTGGFRWIGASEKMQLVNNGAKELEALLIFLK